MFRQNTYTEGDLGTLIPLSRQAVVPGQSAALDVSCMFETPPFSSQRLSGARASMYAFYVPYRLLWDGWMSFVARQGGTVPITAVPFPQVFDVAAASGKELNCFMRRAYKLAFNQFFGSDEFGQWYTDITSDSDVSVKYVRTLDQFVSHLVGSNDLSTPSYSAPVVGTDAVIPLNDFRQAMRDAASIQRSDMTGDKYVDAMQRMGVSLDWRVQMAPEFLGASHADCWPKRTRVTTPDDAGKPVAYYSEQMNLKVPRKFFAEHGLVFTCLVVRPMLFQTAASGGFAPVSQPVDGQANFINEFFLGDNQAGLTPYPAKTLTSTVNGSVYGPRFGYLKWGQNLVGSTSFETDPSHHPWFNVVPTSGLDGQVYPVCDFNPAPELEHEVAVLTTYRSDGPSPVKVVM